MDNRSMNSSVLRKGVVCNFLDASGVSRASCCVCGCSEQPNWKEPQLPFSPHMWCASYKNQSTVRGGEREEEN